MGSFPEILQALSGFGPSALFVAFLIWDRTNLRQERIDADNKRSEADKALAASLTALTTTMQTMQQMILTRGD